MTQHTLRYWWEVFASKGPVNIRGAQFQYENARRHIEGLLLPEERSALSTARSHAIDCGEGRGEWDALCATLAQRLGL